jgi:hypothetical protein
MVPTPARRAGVLFFRAYLCHNSIYCVNPHRLVILPGASFGLNVKFKERRSVTFDPDGIILGGGIAAEADLLIEPILHCLEGALSILPNLLVSTLGFHAVVMGTLINPLYSSSELYVVQKLM